MNKVIILGTLTKEVEVKHTQQGKAIAKINLAHNERFTAQNGEKKDKAMFIECVAFDRGAEVLQQYFHKGSRILIEGKLNLESWQTQSGESRSKHTIIIEKFDFVDKANSNQPNNQVRQASQTQSYNQRQVSQSAPTQWDTDDDSIPF